MSWGFRSRAIEVAARLNESTVARDRKGDLPFAEVDWLRQSRLLHLLVPEAAGGVGGTWSQAVEATRIVATADASIAHLLGYHYFNYLSSVLGALPEQRAAIDQAEWQRTGS